jgi:hypothetical protein
MYSWLWQRLPGNQLTKFLIASLGVAVVLAGLYFLVFPWLDGVLYSEPTQGL